MLKRNVLNFFKFLLVATPFLKKICIFFSSSCPRILMYHRFNLSYCESTLLDEFKWQLDFLNLNFNVIKLADYVTQGKGLGKAFRAHAMITVDDGYYDFYKYAYPELVKRGLPATFFITTAFVSRELWLWFDQLRYIVDKSHKNTIDFCFENVQFNLKLQDNIAKNKSWNYIADYCLRLPEDSKAEFVKLLAEKCNINLSILPPKEYSAVTWEQLRDISTNNIEIGTHTVTHPVLSALDENGILKELLESKHKIEQEIKQKIITIAIPFGTSEDYNDLVIKLIEHTGYQGAVTAHGGITSHINKFGLSRIAVTDNRAEFLWKVCGFEYYLNMIKHLLGGFCKF